MFVLDFVEGSTTASTALGITKVYNTNDNIKLINNQLQMITPGMYEISGNITVESTATSGNFGAMIYANGEQVSNGAIVSAQEANQVATIPIYGVVEVTPTNTSGYGIISFMPSGTPTVLSGQVSIKLIV